MQERREILRIAIGLGLGLLVAPFYLRYRLQFPWEYIRVPIAVVIVYVVGLLVLANHLMKRSDGT